MTDLWLRVDALAGTDIVDSAIPAMVALADRIGIGVKADLNGVKVLVPPGCNARLVADQWNREMQTDRGYKVICGQGQADRADGGTP